MMRKTSLFLLIIIMVTVGLAFPQAQGGGKDKLSQKDRLSLIKRAYAYVEEQLLITPTDLYCSYFIRGKISEDLMIIGADEMDTNRENYTSDDKMHINKGSTGGIKEGDFFLVIQKGFKVSNLLTHDAMGILYAPKSLAEVTCLYENSATVILRNACNPVNIGDIVIPFKARPTVFKKKIDYKRCRLPQAIGGNVVYTSFFMKSRRLNVGPEEYVTIDMGKALVSEGNFVIFYKGLRKNLPPIIFGSGIIVTAENNNSTVKVLESAWPVEIGTRVVLVPKTEEPVDAPGKTEEIPIIKALQTEERPVEPGEETMEANIMFNMNEKSIADMTKYADDFEKIKAFIASKSQYVVVLRGYTCSIGGLEYNLALSKERVEFVKAYLINTLAIPENFIETHFYGEKDAPYDNTSEEQRRKNRSVNIQVIGK
jgi:outer membrane protein OmpA-like peptidoglycan-associated protein